MRERLLGVADDLEAVVDDDAEAAEDDAGLPSIKPDRSSGNGIWDSSEMVRLPELSPMAPDEDEEQRDR